MDEVRVTLEGADIAFSAPGKTLHNLTDREVEVLIADLLDVLARPRKQAGAPKACDGQTSMLADENDAEPS